MARLSKRIQQKNKKPAAAETRKREKPGRDIFLIICLVSIVFILAATWSMIDMIDRGMYISLALSLLFTYISKHADLTDQQSKIVMIASLVSMVAAFSLFLKKLLA
jgi:hypothetical protein